MSGRNGIRWVVAPALVVAVALSSCTTPAPAAQPKPGGKEFAPPAIPITTTALFQGNIAATLVYSGNVQSRAQVNIVPRVTGRVERLTVDVGDEISTGQLLAELDRANADTQIQQQEAAVAVAQARLAQTQAGARQEDIDAAAASVRSAQVRLDQARSGARAEEIEASRAQVGQARSRLDALIAGPEQEELSGLDAAVDQSRAQQESIRAQLTASGATLTESRFRLDQARAGLGGRGSRAEDIASAQSALNAARSRLDQLRAGARPEDLRASELGLERARSNLIAAEEALENCGRSITETRNQSRSETRTAQGNNRQTVESQQRSQTNCTETQRDQLTAQRNQARLGVRESENTLERTRAGATPFETAQAQEAVRQAEANLQRTRFGGTTDLATLELGVSQAQADLERLQAQLEQAQGGLDAAQLRVDAARNPSVYDIRNAQETVNQAQANLARLVNPNQFDVRTAQAAVDQAQAQLSARQRPTAEDIRIAAAQVDQAVAGLEAARVNAAESVIRSPFNAIVSQRLVSPGAIVGPQTSIYTLVSRETEILLQVEEARIGQVQVGQTAQISVTAYPGETFAGTVTSVSPVADPRSRTFGVRIIPNDPQARLRDGMFAQVSLQTASRQALLAPVQAVVNRSGRNILFVVTPDNRVQARDVVTGVNDGRQVEIIQGGNVGEDVAVSGLDVLTDGTSVVPNRQG